MSGAFGSAQPGAWIQYQIAVTNRGPGTGTGIRLINAAQPGLQLVSATSPSGTCAINQDGMVCDLADLPRDDGATVTVLANPSELQGLSVSNMASVSAAQRDDKPANNLTTVVMKPPLITAQPQSQTVMALTNVTFSVVATGSGPFTYQWQRSGTNLSDDDRTRGAQTATLTISNVQPADAGSYLVAVHNALGLVTSAEVVLVVTSVIGEAVDATNLPWITGGDATWFRQISVTRDGLDAAQSGRIFNSQRSWVVTSVTGPGILTFWWKVSSEWSYDNFRFILNGIQRSAISGGSDWREAKIYLPAVSNVVRWEYTKDESETDGQDAGWLDQVIFAEGPSLPPTLAPWGDWHPWHTPPPALLYELTNVVAVAGGNGFSLALNSDGTVVAWGENGDGQTDVPPRLTNVVAVAASLGAHSLALKADGTVVAWGWNGSGQTNVPTGLSNVVAIAAGETSSLALRADGRVVGFYDGSMTLPGLTNIVAIAAGGTHNLGLRDDGTVVSWGSWMTNVPARLTNVVAIAAGRDHSLALKGDGTVVAWGWNSTGQTNVPVGLTNVVAIAAGASHSLALRIDGTVVAWGDNSFGQCSIPAGLSSVTFIAAGGAHSLAISGDGSPFLIEHPAARISFPGQTIALRARAAGRLPLRYQWQRNGVDIPKGTNALLNLSQLQPENSGTYSVVVSNSIGSVVSRGANLAVLGTPLIVTPFTSRVTSLYGSATLNVTVDGLGPFTYQWQLNGANLVGETNAELRLNSLTFARAGNYSVTVSNPFGSVTRHMAALHVIPVVAWGHFWTGSDNPSVSLSERTTNVVAISGHYGIVDDGAMVVLGQNDTRSHVPFDLSDIVTLAESRDHTLALRSNGTVIGWGYGGGTNVPAGLTDVVALAAGGYHSLALRSDGSLVGWGYGYNSSGQAGVSNVVAIAAGESHSLVLKGDGTMVAWVAYYDEFGTYYGQAHPPRDLTDVIAIASGDDHNLALRANGTVVAWGRNNFGQTNVPPGLSNVIAVAARYGHSLALKGDGTVVAWGANFDGQTNVPSFLSNAVAIAAGPGHSVSLVGYGPPVLIADQLTNRTAFKGGRVFLRATATGALPLRYQWRRDGVDIPEGTNSTLTVTHTNAGRATYTVVVSNPFGSATSLGTTLTTSESRPIIFVHPPSQVRLLHSPATLGVITGGSEPLTYRWRFNGIEIPGATNAVLQFTRLTLAMAGNYSVVVSNPFGSIASANALLSVVSVATWGEPRPVPASLSNAVAVAAGGAANLALKADGTVIGWGWDYGGQTNVPPDLTNVIAIAGGNYHGLALKRDGTVAAWGGWGQHNPPPGLQNVVAIAAGAFHSLALKANGTVNAWGIDVNGPYGQTTVPAGLSNVVAIAANRDHSLALKDDGTVVYWGRNYYEYDGFVRVPPNLANVVAISGSLALKADGTVGWSLWSTVPPDFTNLVVIGENLGLKADGTIAASPYGVVPEWLTNVVGLAGTDSRGLAVVGDGLPALTVQPVDRTLVEGYTAQLAVMAVGSGALNFQWQFNGANIVGATNRILSLSNVQPERAGDYRVIVSNALGAMTSRVARLTVLQRPRLEPLPESTLVAVGAEVALTANATGTPPLRYQWRKNGANIPGATNTTFTLTNAQISDGGSYSVVVANDVDIAVSEPTLLVVAVPMPVADHFADRVVVTRLTNSISGTNRFTTKESGERNHAGKRGGKSVWYTWRPPTNGIATFGTRGSTFDTLLGIYTNDFSLNPQPSLPSLGEVASDEDRGGFFTSEARFNAVAGLNYYLAVDGFAGADGNFVLSWELEPTEETIPVLTLQPVGQAVLPGTNVTFIAQASGAGLTYQWLFNGAAIGGATSTNFTRSNVQSAHVGFYSVRVRNSFGREAESLPVTLEIGSRTGQPLSEDKLEDLFAGNGAGSPSGGGGFAAAAVSPFLVSLGSIDYRIVNNTDSTTQAREPAHCSTIGNATRWLLLRPESEGTFVLDTHGSVETNGNTMATVLAVYTTGATAFDFPQVTCNDDGATDGSRVKFSGLGGREYYVVADGADYAKGLIQLNWQFGVPPPPVTNGFGRHRLRPGEGVVLQAPTTNGIPPPHFRWFWNGRLLAGQTSASLVLSQLQSTNGGFYTVEVDNGIGAVTHTTQVEVEEPLLLAVEPQLSQGMLRLRLPALGEPVPGLGTETSFGIVLEATSDLSDPFSWHPVYMHTNTAAAMMWEAPTTNGLQFFRARRWP